MTGHDLALASLGVWLALAALAAVQFAAEVRWRRSCTRRTRPPLEEHCATPWTDAPKPQPHGTPDPAESP